MIRSATYALSLSRRGAVNVKWPQTLSSSVDAPSSLLTATAPRGGGGRCFSSSSSSSGVEKKVLYDVISKESFGDYKEYSVIFTNRSLNLMSDPFQRVMRDLNTLLKETYNARKIAIIPG